MSPKVTELRWRDPPLAEMETPKGRMRLTFGPGSGLTRRAGDAPGIVWGVGDRGPNMKVHTAVHRWGLEHLACLADREGAKVLPLPDFQPCLAKLRVGRRRVRLERLVPLRVGRVPMSGRPLPGSPEAAMEPAFDLAGRVLPLDPLGADTEGVAAVPDGGFWVAEEYGPSLLRVDGRGRVTRRWMPMGRQLPGVEPVLPAKALRRRLNRGFEAVAASGDGGRVYAGFQSALIGDPAEQTLIWTLDGEDGALLQSNDYPFDPPTSFTADAAAGPVSDADLKVGDITWIAPDQLLVLERISRSSRIYRVDVSRPGLLKKTLVFSTDDAPEVAPDIEGMTAMAPNELLLSTDNDFGVEEAATRFYRLTFERPLAA